MQVLAKIYQLVLIKTVVLETFQMAVCSLCMHPGGWGGGWVREKRLCAGVGLLEKERPPRASYAQTRRKEALEEDGQMEWKKTGGQRGEAVGDEEGTRERDGNGG